MLLYIVVNRAGPSLKDEELYWLLNKDPSFNNSSDNENDMVDQQCGTYSVARATRRWPLVIFSSLMDLAGINAQVIFFSNETNQKKIKDTGTPHILSRV